MNKKKIDKKSKFKGNPRQITKESYNLLKDHLEELGDLSGVVYCHTNKAYVGGNQRSEVFNGSDIEIVEKYDEPTEHHTLAYGFIKYKGEKYAYREVSFTKELFDKACIVANSDGGTFDWNILENKWNTVALGEWGLHAPGLKAKMADDNYSRNIEAPIYEPKGEKPSIKDLFDNEKANKLIEAINKSSLGKKEKDFLKLAAGRHIVFNYQKVADFYAHSDKEVQELMEESAMVIIDFKKAIELGYVNLTKGVSEKYTEDYADEN